MKRTTWLIGLLLFVFALGGVAFVQTNRFVFSQIQTILPGRILGNNGGSAATIQQLSGTQATALLDTFTSGAKGLAPASGGGTTNFLRADGTWAAPSGGNIQTLLDGIGSTRGSILYRGASGWAILAPGTSGNVLTSNGSGADPSYQAAAAGYSDEQAQDAVGAMAETNSLQYTDATPELKVKRQMSITADGSGLKLDGDSATPGNNKLYGTNSSGVKGWYDQPSGGGGGGSTTGVEAHRTADLTLSNNAWTTIVFTTEDRDQNNEYNNSTGEFTAGATGWYNWGFFSEIIDGDIYPLNVYARVSKDSGSGYSEFFRFYSFQNSNGGPKKYAPHGGGPIYLTSGDKLKWEIYQDGNFQNLQYTSSRLFIVRMP